jgi:hypothetical protein
MDKEYGESVVNACVDNWFKVCRFMKTEIWLYKENEKEFEWCKNDCDECVDYLISEFRRMKKKECDNG